jgi:bifunctional non-homologous end joining protein LigD
VIISHPEKVLFPDDGITKGELTTYYKELAPVILPHVRGRPLTMERYPQGIGKKGFWQKDVSKGFPEWLQRVAVPKKDGVVHYPIITDLESLMWVANQNTITQHVWVSREPSLDHPDECVFDLDPSVDDPASVRKTALELRDLLDELGLPSWVKTSGSKGFHIVVPLDGKTTTGEVARFAVRSPGSSRNSNSAGVTFALARVCGRWLCFRSPRVSCCGERNSRKPVNYVRSAHEIAVNVPG